MKWEDFRKGEEATISPSYAITDIECPQCGKYIYEDMTITFIFYMYIAIIVFSIVFGIAFMIGKIIFVFKTLTSNELPFWFKWVLITR